MKSSSSCWELLAEEHWSLD